MDKPAKRICIQCPVKQQCLDYAMESREKEGIWGGMNSRERDNLRRTYFRRIRNQRKAG